MPLHSDGTYRQGGIDSRYNICTGHSSWYADDLDEVRHMARQYGVRFVNAGGTHDEYIPGHDEGGPVGQIGGTLMTRYTDESLDLFHLFRDEDDFAGFLPVNRDELRIALDALALHRQPPAVLTREQYDRLHELTQRKYRRDWDTETRVDSYHLVNP